VRTLVLLRHGKSGYPPGVDDHDRPLAERGEGEAVLAGAAIARSLADALGQSEVIDLALVSSATRAQQTWQRAQPQLPPVTEQVTDAGVYLATDDELLAVVRNLPPGARCVLVVGHNDGLEVVASRLSGEDVILKTSTFAVLRSSLPWRKWSDGGASLVDVVVAR
jgi:phosphohistidine phosphatase